MALEEVLPPQKFWRFTCDDDCRRLAYVTAIDEAGAVHRVQELHFWQVDEHGHRCPQHSEGRAA